MIATALLEQYNTQLKFFPKNTVLFNEKQEPLYYYQILTGNIKMFNLMEDGKEFVQGFFEDNNSFAEPPLFGNFKYPASAETTSDSYIYILPKDAFLTLLKAHPEEHLNLTQLICRRMIYKAKIMKEVSIYPPEHRILTLLNHFKTADKQQNTRYEVKLTRQQISELTGLRVETVIRAIKKLEKSNKLSILDRKVYL
ncbi:Crp/Fnr family transcriptional regulator [Bizionia gelidisalsuginis]|uniref:Crp/Fnr family transcriptional regulator n=1 Tax=Bizionia gelidisalsuginis TaxID=291188 RepID=A0ABY3M940_9FLAO|nr:Crp/Fnr family transcriptional regulator [Bizionia gelidisalsuginis]TYC10782.1 Crp/Fnr family transcriptional regulator [Bizionia gelidisalsuginis]